MKVLVAYATVTGNTEVIARAIASAIPGADLKKLPADVNPHDYDFIFAGFWCDKGTPDEVWQAFQKEAKAKPIAYFGTMGGDPNSERGQAWVNKVAGLFPCENFKGLRVWQGKIDPKILAAMAKMPGAKRMPSGCCVMCGSRCWPCCIRSCPSSPRRSGSRSLGFRVS